MTKGNNSKTIWIIIAIVLGVLLVGGLLIGFSCYSLYKIGTSTTSPAPTTVDTSDWKYYNNARYGFTMNYPNTFSDEESQNGDGVTLTTNDPPLTIRAYGSNNALNQNLDEYLNWVRDNLFQEQGKAEEILAEDVTLGGVPAQERQWTYTNSVDGSVTIMDQVTALSGDKFYTVQMIVGKSSYDEYPAHVFDNILTSFQMI